MLTNHQDMVDMNIEYCFNYIYISYIYVDMYNIYIYIYNIYIYMYICIYLSGDTRTTNINVVRMESPF